MLFGSAFLVDGEYIYIYGYRDADSARELLVARVEKQNFENIETWEFFDGREFCPGYAVRGGRVAACFL